MCAGEYHAGVGSKIHWDAISRRTTVNHRVRTVANARPAKKSPREKKIPTRRNAGFTLSRVGRCGVNFFPRTLSCEKLTQKVYNPTRSQHSNHDDAP